MWFTLRQPLASSKRAQALLIALTAVMAVVAAEYTFALSDTCAARSSSGSTTTSSSPPGSPASRAASSSSATGSPGSRWALRCSRGAIGNTVWTFTVADLPDPPYPSVADIGFLAVYPPAYVALVLLLRSRVRELRSSLWLDGVISGAAVGAIGTAVILPAILNAAGGSSRAAVTTNIAYPLLDLTLIGMVVWALAVTGWRPGRTWGFVAAGLLVFSVSDCLYLYETAVGTYTNGSPTDIGWAAGAVLIAWAAWQPRSAEPSAAIEGWALLAAPVVFGLLGLAVLLYDHNHPVNPLSLDAREHVDPRRHRADGADLRREHADARALARGGAHRHAHRPRQPPPAAQRPRAAPRDAATRGSRWRSSTSTASSSTTTRSATPPATCCSAGSARTSRASSTAAATPTGWAATSSASCSTTTASRRSSCSPAPSARCASTARASTSRASYGMVTLPDEAANVSDALGLADQRMYAQKKAGRLTAGERSTSILLTALSERPAKTSEQLPGVVEFTEALAREARAAARARSRARG